MAGSFLRSASFYSSASMLTTLIGLASFPILTRLFDVGQYGMLGLVSATIPVLVGIGKLGLQHASLRFYSEIRAEDSRWSLDEFYGSLLLSLLGGSCITWLAMNGFLSFWGREFFDQRLLITLLGLASWLVVTRVFESVFLNLLRAKEWVARYSIYIVLKRLLVFVSTVSVLYFHRIDLVLYFKTLLAVEVLFLIGFALYARAFVIRSVTQFRLPLAQSMLAIGVPLLGTELCLGLISISDRYVINAYLGAEPLGAYTSAYTLIEYAIGFVIMALVNSAQPMYFRIDVEEGRDAAARFVSRSLRVYVMAIALVLLMVASGGHAALTFLASDKYATGAVIMPTAAAAWAIQGALPLLAAGLFLAKKTRLMLTLFALTMVGNLLLNVWLVPKFGIFGAAVSTFVCYSVCMTCVFIASRQYISVALPWRGILAAAFAGLASYCVLSLYQPAFAIWSLVYTAVVGTSLYLPLYFLFDPGMREEVQTWLRSR